MNLVKWDPFKELEDVSSRLNRIFWRVPARTETDREMLAVADWAPSVDISETDTAYLVKAEIPGVKKEDVKVTIQDGMLTLQGERKQEKEEKGKKFHRIERCYGSFARSFRVPDDADENSVKAEFKDGVLNVTLSKSEKAKPKQINVSVS
ncbi:MAG: heat-shock protein Hsp20 [Gallionellales bacterium GWA2_55_18]|nr:MAG: heat-shock protein Hsp20 [Gallionellales bacterium GWA2_55_18]